MRQTISVKKEHHRELKYICISKDCKLNELIDEIMVDYLSDKKTTINTK